MAYLDLAEPGFAAAPAFATSTAHPANDAGVDFNRREWTVIRMARQDRLSSLREESDFKEFLRFLFGFERQRPLSDPRLEALRRIAVLSWHHGYNVAASEVRAFLSAGFSGDQYDAMLAHVGRERAASSQRIRR